MTGPVERTDDGRHIIVNGRRWRASNPDIPAPLRAELVKELMAARRAVRGSIDDAATAAARRRVQRAKIALGERGEPWWEPPSASGQRERTAAAIRALLGSRADDASMCPSEAARVVGSPTWRPLMDTVRDVGAALADTGVIEVTQGNIRVLQPSTARGPLHYRRGPNFLDDDGGAG